MNTYTIPNEYETKPILSLKSNLWLLGIAVLLCAVFLAFSELPKDFLELSLMDQMRSIFRNVGVEILRAVVLVVNVQVLRVAGKKKYWIVLILSIVSTLGIGIAIWFHHGTIQTPAFWVSEVLNLLILAGELSLTFLIGGRGIDHEKMNRVIEKMKGVISGHEQEMNRVISEMKGNEQKMKGVISKHETEMDRVVSEMKGIISRHDTLHLESIPDILQRFEHVYAELNRLGKQNKVCEANAKILKHPGLKITGLGAKAGVCSCSRIIVADYNAQTEKECPSCKKIVKL